MSYIATQKAQHTTTQSSHLIGLCDGYGLWHEQVGFNGPIESIN